MQDEGDDVSERGFYSSAETVFWAFLDEAIAKKFLLGLSAGKITSCEIDAKAGGRISLVEEKDGQLLRHEGEFSLLEVPSHISFRLDSCEVRVEIRTSEASGQKNGCHVTIDWAGVSNLGQQVLEGLAVALDDGEQAATAGARRFFSVPASEVFDAWVDPVTIGKFMFSVSDGRDEVIEIKLNPELGGAFSFIIRRGGKRIVHSGNYLAVHRPVQLAFTWGAEENTERSEVNIEIEPAPDGCEVFLTQSLPPAWASFKTQAEASWQKMLNALASELDAE
jgi:uncharacterized protein YndB with AHSA1/START domain